MKTMRPSVRVFDDLALPVSQFQPQSGWLIPSLVNAPAHFTLQAFLLLRDLILQAKWMMSRSVGSQSTLRLKLRLWERVI